MEKQKETEDHQLSLNAENDAELLHEAIQELVEEKRARRNNGPGDCFLEDDERVLLSRLTSQLESSKGNVPMESSIPASETDEVKDECVDGPKDGSREAGQEAILKELRKVTRQNRLTHWLLSTMIFVTVVWQLSEVSLIMKVKSTMSHPFKVIGSGIKGILPGQKKDENIASRNLNGVEDNSLRGEWGLESLDIDDE